MSTWPMQRCTPQKLVRGAAGQGGGGVQVEADAAEVRRLEPAGLAPDHQFPITGWAARRGLDLFPLPAEGPQERAVRADGVKHPLPSWSPGPVTQNVYWRERGRRAATAPR